MSRIIYFLINLITKLHTKFLSINDNSGLALTDKQLHFIVIGAFGFGLVFIIQPIVKWLAKHDLTLFITFAYVFTVVIVVSFSIEIGQWYSGTGTVDFYDIASGIVGFFIFFIIYTIFYLIYRAIRNKSNNNQVN